MLYNLYGEVGDFGRYSTDLLMKRMFYVRIILNENVLYCFVFLIYCYFVSNLKIFFKFKKKFQKLFIYVLKEFHI